VCDNNVLGMVRQWQTLFHGGRFSQTVLGGPPDFVKLAESYGVAGFRATDEAAFSVVLQNALAVLKKGGGALIAAHIDRDEMVLPMVPGGKPVDEQILQ
jgi:acetolactate synthase-1/2/3 large subunit